MSQGPRMTLELVGIGVVRAATARPSTVVLGVTVMLRMVLAELLIPITTIRESFEMLLPLVASASVPCGKAMPARVGSTMLVSAVRGIPASGHDESPAGRAGLMSGCQKGPNRS